MGSRLNFFTLAKPALALHLANLSDVNGIGKTRKARESGYEVSEGDATREGVGAGCVLVARTN